MNSHLFRVYSVWNSANNGDRQETAHFRANDVDQVLEYIKTEWFKKDFQEKLEINYFDEGALIESSLAVDELGNELTEDQAEKLVDEGDDPYISEGYEIQQDDDIEEDFHTIYGGNDFYDLTKPKGQQHGITSADTIKEAGSIEGAFFKKGSGQGFESGVKGNEYNLNNQGNLKLYNPKEDKKNVS